VLLILEVIEKLMTLLQKNTKGKGNVEVLDMAIQQLGDEQLL